MLQSNRCGEISQELDSGLLATWPVTFFECLQNYENHSKLHSLLQKNSCGNNIQIQVPDLLLRDCEEEIRKVC